MEEVEISMIWLFMECFREGGVKVILDDLFGLVG